MVNHIACKAAGTVSALLYLVAIGIENSVDKIRLRAGRVLHQKDLIRPNAQASVCHGLQALGGQRIGRQSSPRINDDEVVARAMHLGERNARGIAHARIIHRPTGPRRAGS